MAPSMIIESEIDEYITYFQTQLSKLDKVSSALFRCILYLVVIDTLAKAAWPREGSNRQRFLKFIDECSGWADKDRVSSPQLLLCLDEKGHDSSKLVQLLTQRVRKWSNGNIIRPDSDPFFADILSIAKPDEKRVVELARYKELLYTFRNNVIHEFRIPGYGMDISKFNDTPYYHGMIGDPWQLVFSDAFIRKVCIGSFAGFRRYLNEKKINPYDSFKLGSVWSPK